jgi:hypothetical protein
VLFSSLDVPNSLILFSPETNSYLRRTTIRAGSSWTISKGEKTMTIGDILAVIAAVLLAGASWGATLIMTALLAPSVVGRAEEMLARSPGACVGRGIGVMLLVAVVAAVFHAAGPLRLISGALWCLLVLMSAVGGAAVVKMMAERIGGLGTEMAPFARLTRAATLYVGAGFVPVAGWFLVTPLAAFATVGAGVAALRRATPTISTAPSQMSLPHLS